MGSKLDRAIPVVLPAPHVVESPSERVSELAELRTKIYLSKDANAVLGAFASIPKAKWKMVLPSTGAGCQKQREGKPGGIGTMWKLQGPEGR